MTKKILLFVILCMSICFQAHAAIVKYQDVAQDRLGNAISGALVQVYLTGTQTSATLYTSASGQTTTSNPATTDSNGTFSFFITEGTYDLEITKSTMTTQNKTAITIGGGKSWIETSDYPTISAANSAAVAAGKSLRCTNAITISSSTTISAYFIADKGCTFTESGTGTINFSSGFEATGEFQIFYSFEKGDITGIKKAIPQWWGGNSASASTDAVDSSTAVECALSAYDRSKVELSQGFWRFNITFDGNDELYGHGARVVSAATDSTPIITIDGENNSLERIYIHDLIFTASTASEKLATGLRVKALSPAFVKDSSFERLRFYNMARGIWESVPASSSEVYSNRYHGISMGLIKEYGIISVGTAYTTYSDLTIGVDGSYNAVAISAQGTNSEYVNVVSDGRIVNTGWGNAFKRVKIETVLSLNPVSQAFLVQGQWTTIDDLMMINIDTATCPIGLYVTSIDNRISRVSRNGVKPETLVSLLPGSAGILSSIGTSTTDLWDANPTSIWDWDVLGGNYTRLDDLLNTSVSATTTEVSLHGLSSPGYMYMTQDEGYDVEFFVKNDSGGSVTYGLYFYDQSVAALATETTYRRSRVIYGYGSASPTTDYITTSAALFSMGSGSTALLTGRVTLSPEGYPTLHYNISFNSGVAHTGVYYVIPATTVTEVRGMAFNGRGSANAIAPTSRFRLWRKKFS